MSICSNCNRENEESAKICVYCGEVLVTQAATSTRALDNTDFEEGRPQWGTARFNARMNLIINVRGAVKPMVFDANEVEELVIGRMNPDTGEAPDIDLHEFDAVDKGVSRRHASIVRRDNSLNILDLGSPNGTFLNGQRLIANQPRILRDGDELRLGHLVLRITFKRA